MQFQIIPGLEYRKLGGEGIILDPETGRFFRLSPQATECWEALTRGEHDIQWSNVMQELESCGLLLTERPVTSTNSAQISCVQVVETQPFLQCGCSTATNQGACKKIKGCTWDTNHNPKCY